MEDNTKTVFDPRAKAEERKKEMEEITAKLEKGVKDVFTSDGYKAYLNFCSKLPRYSVNNQILIMLQKPDATMCQSFENWKAVGRNVKKGEKGIRIIAPAPYKKEREIDRTDKDGNVVMGKNGGPIKDKVEVTINAFKPVSTFDISQTEGAEVPTIGVKELIGGVDGYEMLFNAIKESIPVPVTFEKIETDAKGYFNVDENRIVVKEGMSEAQTVKTLLHEASHQALHSKEAMKEGPNKTKNQKETEAESVAFVVCAHYGIDVSDYSFGYVASWSKDKEVPELKASLDTIRKTASELITKIDEKLKTMDMSREMDKFLEAHGDELPFAKPEALKEKKPSVKDTIKKQKEKATELSKKRNPPKQDLQKAL